MKYKALLHHTYTKRDNTGKTYYTTTITNPQNGRCFTISTTSPKDARKAFYLALPNEPLFYETATCTDMYSLSSLPDTIFSLNGCHVTPELRQALRSIGYRLKKRSK